MKTTAFLTTRLQGRNGQFPRRVAFIAHALLPGYKSTELIHLRMKELGLVWPAEGRFPEAFKWFSFPACSGESRVWVDFWIIPKFGPEFDPKVNAPETTYSWTEAVALKAIAEAKADGVKELHLGWGALTKQATDHGRLFLERQGKNLPNWVYTTHGDAGTAVLVFEALRKAGIKSGFRASIVGAYGAIGSLISRVLLELGPSVIQLVGPPDKPGNTTRTEKLEQMRQQMLRLVGRNGTTITTSQDKSRACLENKSDVVIASMVGTKFSPNEVPEHTLVLDLTTPSVCDQLLGWNESSNLVLISGCGQISNLSVIPKRFGQLGGSVLQDVGAGGTDVLWGCTLETIARGLFGVRNNIVGDQISLENFSSTKKIFSELGFVPQQPFSFGKTYSWQHVQNFVSSLT